MSGEVLKKFVFGATVFSVGFSPDGSKIVIGGGEFGSGKVEVRFA